MAQARNFEFFKFSFLLFIAFLVNSNFEFFKFGTLENLCKKVQNNSNKIWIYHFNSLNLYSER